MKFTKDSLILYAVTDRQWLKDKTLAQAAEEAIKGGATFIQLREKNASYEEFKKIALEVKAVTDKYNIPFVINDNVKLCMEINADGVHVGADDMSVKKARELLGRDKIVGGTARTLERAIIACNEGADYLGIGAVFNTSTKEGTTHMTKELANAINNKVNIPTVAIGGINRDNISALSGYGVSGAAVVSAIFAQEDITSACRELRYLADKLKKQ
ncbi:MAG: thiamine phosphate synthase [Clostridia bacterium]|nr:thiamine phosphate synthase [Clostridia bacterium]